MFSPSLSKTYSYELRGNKRKYTNAGKFPPMPMQPPFGKPIKQGDDDDDDDDGDSPMPFKFPKLFGNDHSSDVYTTKNHIYFKTGITKDSIDKLAVEIDNLNNKLSNLSKKASLGTFTPKPIYLHITTNGGDLLAGFFAYDKIKTSKIPIITVIEGCVASAGSLLSMAGTKRYMTANSQLLIHQLRTGIIGTYEELVDESTNCNQFMSRLVNLYKENSNGKLSKTKIKEILKRDIFWDTKTAIDNGLVDEVWTGVLDD
jgi:ATP-dependent Clp protease protease subunit